MKIRCLFIYTFLCWSAFLSAQEFSTQIFIEDAAGRKDTLRIGNSPQAIFNELNPALGEYDIPDNKIDKTIKGDIMNNSTYTWIGLVEISDKPGNEILNDSTGAFVIVLASALSARDFTNKVKENIESMGLEFIQIEDVELFSERAEKNELDKNIINLAIEVIETGEIRFGDFHTFDI